MIVWLTCLRVALRLPRAASLSSFQWRWIQSVSWDIKKLPDDFVEPTVSSESFSGKSYVSGRYVYHRQRWRKTFEDLWPSSHLASRGKRCSSACARDYHVERATELNEYTFQSDGYHDVQPKAGLEMRCVHCTWGKNETVPQLEKFEKQLLPFMEIGPF